MENKSRTGMLAIALTVFLWAPNGWLRAQNEPQPSTGPQAPVGDTVLVPKKTQPAPTTKPPSQSEKINPNDIYTLSTATSLVNVEAIVVDKSGNPIPNLGKKNFRISDDGVPQAVSNFAVAEASLTVCMLVEFSNKWWPFLYMALQNAYGFVDYIRPKDWVAVVSFDTRPQILADFTQNRDEVVGALNQLRMPGFSETDLWDAMSFTIDRMKDIQGRKAILMICSGYDTFSKINYDQALKLAKTTDAAIYPISILEFITVRTGRPDPIEAVQAKNALNTIAEYSGGKAYFPRFEGELPSIYQQISAQLRARYSLGFVPTNTARDGRFHKLKVDVIDEQGNPLRVVDQKGKQVKYKVVARDGYYAPKS